MKLSRAKKQELPSRIIWIRVKTDDPELPWTVAEQIPPHTPGKVMAKCRSPKTALILVRSHNRGVVGQRG